MSRWRKPLEAVSLAGLGTGLLLLLLVRLGMVRFAGSFGFQLVLLIILCSNLFWWSRVRMWIDRGTSGSSGRARALLSTAWTCYMILLLLPILLLPLGFRQVRDSLAVPVLTWTLIWHLLMAFAGPVALVLLLSRRVWRLIRSVEARFKPAQSIGSPVEPATTGAAVSRRGILTMATAAAPLLITGAASLSSITQAGRFRIRRLQLEVPRLPRSLRGLTITHISDIHLGRLFRTEHLPLMVDEANKLKSDLVAVTGDILDHSNDYLPAAMTALSQIEAPFGRYTVLGNHDLFGRAADTVRYVAAHEPNFLNDELKPVDIGGEVIQIAGLFWSRHEAPTGADPGLAGRAAAAMKHADRDRCTIALAHHPHAFEALADLGADMVLAGHTHGGQLMLVPAESGRPLGAGSLMFRYLHGIYRRGQARLYVNSGVGNWFPIRLNAPAEIVQLRLV